MLYSSTVNTEVLNDKKNYKKHQCIVRNY
ncbi:phd finger protein, putative [Schistosoma mansoni]|nr:phd finger protein, putative [Schistosoma mansoni]|eukprot:XP_018645925.1 phd finger protein, putative [Schistosoma mansoni]